jgi:hypothetical protein
MTSFMMLRYEQCLSYSEEWLIWQVTASFIAFWRALPPDFKSNVYNCSRGTQKRARTRLAPNIKLSPQVEPIFNEWKVDYLQFYAQIEGAGFEPEQSPLAGAYSFLCRVETRYTMDRIRKRLLYVVFSRLKMAFHRTQLRGNILTQFARLIRQSGLIDESLEDIEERVGTWACRGDRYQLLSDDLGGLGALILLPQDIGDSV